MISKMNANEEYKLQFGSNILLHEYNTDKLSRNHCLQLLKVLGDNSWPRQQQKSINLTIFQTATNYSNSRFLTFIPTQITFKKSLLTFYQRRYMNSDFIKC